MEKSNLVEIQDRYLLGSNALEGMLILDNYIEQSKDKELKKLLRPLVEDDIISNSETQKRDAIDSLLQYFSILEIAIMIGFIPERLPQDMVSEIMKYLNDKHVRNYYLIHYPIILPQMLHTRLAEKLKNEIEYPSEIIFLHFMEFLSLSNILDEDEDVETFLWFLDDGSIDDFTIEDLWSTLNNSKKLIKALKSSQNTSLNDAIRGYFKFIDFMRSFDSFLQKLHDYKEFQSAVWLYHMYWFDHMKDKLNNVIDKTILFTNININSNKYIYKKKLETDGKVNYPDIEMFSEMVNDDLKFDLIELEKSVKRVLNFESQLSVPVVI
ncbi:MAG: hypothetical protein IPP71_10130 [Bacteroidetes bacterium]|nr:hypothetical protein [Bacteroidota bacterium]